MSLNTILSVIGCLSMIIGLVMPIVLQFIANANRRYNDEQPAQIKRSKYNLLMILGMILVILSSSFGIIPTGYTGVRTTFGQISQETVPNGFVWKIPFAQEIKLVNNKQQDVRFESEVWGEAANKTPVYASDIIVTYQINPGNGAWIYANVSDTRTLISQELVASATKAAMVQLDVNDVTNRAMIEPAVKDELTDAINEKYGADKISILKIVINQMDFEPEYNAAIQQKSLAQQEQERQKIENQTAIEKAEADKTVAITNAEAQADARRIAAEANAEAVKIAADAEAEANQKIRESLSDELLKSKFYDKWDGKLPAVMGPEAVIADIGDQIDVG